MAPGNVGIFFLVNGEVISDAAPLAQGEHYGETIGFGGHYDFWLALGPKTPTEQLFKSHAYDYFPRGRVVYFKKSNNFRLYADRCISKISMANIAAAFKLPAYRLARDEHYQCAKCNTEYLDI